MSNQDQLNSFKTKTLNLLLSCVKFPERGFTLTELLLASMIGALIVGAAGFNLIRVLETSSEAEELNSRKLDLNRALYFIAQETQYAEKIVAPGTITNFSAATGTSNVEEVIALEIPNDKPGATEDYKVVYYIAQPPSGSVWSGQRVIYRWGPSLTLDGDYPLIDTDSNLTTDEYNSANNNINRVFIDSITDQPPTQNSNCPSGWSAYPAQGNRLGFYACVDDESIASIYIEGAQDQSDNSVSVESKIFARLAD